MMVVEVAMVVVVVVVVAVVAVVERESRCRVRRVAQGNLRDEW